MSRRRLEDAILVGKAIEQGAPLPSDFDKIDVQQTYYFGEEKDGLYSLQYSYDGSLLAVGFGDSGIELINTTSGKMDKELRKHKYGALAVTCIRFNPREHHVCFAATSEGTVHACNTENTSIHDMIHESGNEINCLDFCEDGSVFATAGKDLDIRIYDTVTATRLMNLSGYHALCPEQDVGGHAQRIFALKFHPDHNDVFISGGWDNHLKIWDARSKRGVERIVSGPHICGDGLDIKGDQILTASWTHSNALQLWDYGSGRLIDTYPLQNAAEHGEFLYCAQFCDGDIVLAGGSGTHSIQAINMTNKQVLGELTYGKAVQALDCFNGGRLFAFGGTGTQLKMGKLS